MAQLIFWNSINTDYAPIRTLSCHALANWLRNYGYTVKVIDFCQLMPTSDLVEITERHIDKHTLAVGVSSTFWSPLLLDIEQKAPNWVTLAREKIESRHPDLQWLLGGAKSKDTDSRFNWIRFHGYAEDQMLLWLNEKTKMLKPVKNFDIAFSGHSFQKDDFIQPSEPLPIELGRGCQFKCKFCSFPLNGKKPGTYLRDSKLIKDEFIKNYETWGTTKYFYVDDTVNESYGKIKDLAEVAQSLPFEISWTGYNRLDLIAHKPDTIQMLKDSGLKSVFFGIESFHPKASLTVGKGWNGKHAKKFLLDLKSKWDDEITWFISLIVGLPGEDEESLQHTSSWCQESGMYDWKFFPLWVTSDANKLWKSEFDQNYGKYGYHFDSSKASHEWKNKDWDFQKALKYAEKLNDLAPEKRKPTTFLLTELTALGYSHKDLMHQQKINLPWQEFREKTRAFVDQYVRFQLKG